MGYLDEAFNTAKDDAGAYVNDLIGQPQNNPQNGVLQQTWNFVTSGYQAIDELGGNKQANANALANGQALVTGSKPTPLGDPITPASPAPTLADATTTAVQQQLSDEGRAYRANGGGANIGGAGLLDQPTTASRVLLGS